VFPWIFKRFRGLLYLSNPAEESFEFPHQVPDYHTETFPLLVTFVFLEWIVLRLQGKSLPLIGDSFAAAGMTMLMECTRLLTRGLEHSAYFFIYQNYRLIELPWDSPITWYFAAIFTDFCYYWGHRATHEIHFLWAHHQAHHSGETMSLINNFRLPFMQDSLFSLAYLPMALIISPAHYLVHMQFNLIFPFFLHTELIGKLGPLEWIFNTPSNHRVHHGSNKFCLDKNYGNLLVVWDRIFGTYQEETDEPIVYGLVDQVKSFNPVYLQVFYFKKIYDKWQSVDGWKNKIFSVIKGPGWYPGTPWTGNLDEVPDTSSRKSYTYEPFPLPWYIYTVVHFIISTSAYLMTNFLKEVLGPVSFVCHLAFLVITLGSIGMQFDRNPIAPYVEFLRCAFLYLYSLNGIELFTTTWTYSGLNTIMDDSWHTNIQFLLRSYFLLSAMGWAIISVPQIFKMSKSKVHVQ